MLGILQSERDPVGVCTHVCTFKTHLHSSSVQELPLLARLRAALDASGLAAVVRKEVHSAGGSNLLPALAPSRQQQSSNTGADPFASPEAVSQLLSGLLEHRDALGSR